MYLFSHRDNSGIIPELLAFGRELLTSDHVFQSNPGIEMHGIEEIAKRCLSGPEHEQTAQQIFQKIVAFPWSKMHQWDHLIRIVGEFHPKPALDVILKNDESAKIAAPMLFGRTNDDPDRTNLSALNDNMSVLLEWIQDNPQKKALRLAQYVSFFVCDEEGSMQWSPLAVELIANENLGTQVLDIFFHRFYIGAGSGHWSNRFVKRRPLITQLENHSDEAIQLWAAKALIQLDNRIKELQEGGTY